MVDKYWNKKIGFSPAGNYRTHNPFTTSCVRMTNFTVKPSEISEFPFANTNDYFIFRGARKVEVRNNGDFELHIDEARHKDSGETLHNVIYIDNIRSFLLKICGVDAGYMSFTGNCYKGNIDGTGDTLPVTNTSVPICLQDVKIFYKK